MIVTFWPCLSQSGLKNSSESDGITVAGTLIHYIRDLVALPFVLQNLLRRFPYPRQLHRHHSEERANEKDVRNSLPILPSFSYVPEVSIIDLEIEIKN